MPLHHHQTHSETKCNHSQS